MAKAEDNKRAYLLHLNVKHDVCMKICRYMDFDNFLQVLNGQFHVAVKRGFNDKYDAGVKVPRCYLFPSSRHRSRGVQSRPKQGGLIIYGIKLDNQVNA